MRLEKRHLRSHCLGWAWRRPVDFMGQRGNERLILRVRTSLIFGVGRNSESENLARFSTGEAKNNKVERVCSARALMSSCKILHSCGQPRNGSARSAALGVPSGAIGKRWYDEDRGSAETVQKISIGRHNLSSIPGLHSAAENRTNRY
jgi:hypothetical protein